jgi:hypothetical protein
VTEPVGFAHVLPTLVPEVIHSDAWATSLRQQTRALARGWTVEEARGRVRLKVRPDGKPGESLTLPFAWSAVAAGDAYVRIRNLYALVQEGYSLKQAALVADGKAPKLTEQQDWPGCAGALQGTKAAATAPRSNQRRGRPNTSRCLSDAVALLTGRKPPTTPAELIDRCIRNPKWPPWQPYPPGACPQSCPVPSLLRHS